MLMQVLAHAVIVHVAYTYSHQFSEDCLDNGGRDGAVSVKGLSNISGLRGGGCGKALKLAGRSEANP